MNINICLSENIESGFEVFIKEYLNNSLDLSPLKSLNIEDIFVADKTTFPDLVAQISSSHLHTNNDYILSAGKSIGVQRDEIIINYLFYDIEVFQNLYKQNISTRDHDIYNYVIHHELGHSIDHIKRKEIIPPQIRNGVSFNTELSNNYYIYIVKGELSACVFSGYAANSILIVNQLLSLDHLYINLFCETKKYKLDYDMHPDNEIARYNFYSSLAELSWLLIEEFSKIIGYRIGNPELKKLPIIKSPSIPRTLFDQLINLESKICLTWGEYPDLLESFDEAVVLLSNNITEFLLPLFDFKKN